MRKAILEAIVVAIIGVGLAFVANALSPLGLKLSRNYFPGAPHITVATPANPTATSTNASASAPTDVEALAARFKAEGLQLTDHTQTVQLFHDPAFQTGSIIFVDARNEQHYQEAHIPGAYHFDHYHPELYLPTLFPVLQQAQKIVVYCNGGECEDSEFAAIHLGEYGIPKERILVYAGGIKEWAANKLPMEAGQRNSGLPPEARK